ncbi:MAG: hypothetical protein EOO38_16150 [Cytophagaceae bacterium]|nr:MAG: hypothetical protein EOO38_16150 [Cytophagaceae bacterium]
MRALPLLHKHGPYLFVHAGIRPEIAIDEQHPDDLLWIRDEFLNYQMPHDFMVIHGHSPVDDQSMMHSNRIGINTDAFRTGRLTALGIEKRETWTLMTVDELPSSERHHPEPPSSENLYASVLDHSHKAPKPSV